MIFIGDNIYNWLKPRTQNVNHNTEKFKLFPAFEMIYYK